MEKGEKKEISLLLFISCIILASRMLQNLGSKTKKERKQRADGTNPLPFIVNLVKSFFQTITFMHVQAAL